MKVSVVLTVYNNSIYLNRCIQSILDQSYLPYEIIIIDDGSRDNYSKEIYNKYKKLIKIKFFKTKNQGPSKARNFGLKKVKSEYFVFFDPDDMMSKRFIENKIKIFNKEKKPELIGVYSNSILKYNKIEKKLKYKKNISDLNYIDTIGYENGISGSLPTYLFRKDDTFNKIFLDNNLKINEDFDFIIRLLRNKKKVFGTNKFDSFIHMEKSSLTRKKNNRFLIYKNQIKFLKKAKKFKYFSNDELKEREKYKEKLMAKNSLINFKIFDFIKYIGKYLID